MVQAGEGEHVCTSECTHTNCVDAALRAFYAPDGAAWRGMTQEEDGSLRPLFPNGPPRGVSGPDAGRLATMAAMNGMSVEQMLSDMGISRREQQAPVAAPEHECNRCGKSAGKR